MKYTFQGDGTYVLLHKNAHVNVTNLTPDVVIEIRMERYPNRFKDYCIFIQNDSSTEFYFFVLTTDRQYSYDPLNVSFVTGVALQEGDSDRVVITCRKDTRRKKYRTNILVNDEIRYFDTMKLQRYNGKLILG